MRPARIGTNALLQGEGNVFQHNTIKKEIYLFEDVILEKSLFYHIMGGVIIIYFISIFMP